MRTFEYSSTPYILPPPDHLGDPETCHWRDFTPPQPKKPGGPVAGYAGAVLTFFAVTQARRFPNPLLSDVLNRQGGARHV
ncbi:MAG: hypothetical protein P3W95_012060 [Tepidimonas taiwanensis]|nr:hypothetical protein [Tepidimonas taiwanensis]